SRHEFQLTAGDTCFLYTDGVIDQVGGPQRRLFGRKRLIETLEGSVRLPLEDQLAALFQRLDAWQGNEVRRDDMTALAFRPRASATQMALL
ncbi:MAG TPA: SpoIIE family protein phosphatase, partial [Magnetospirillum sp.]|nr:SpoIIE family protein phosphatase [Magnetospirillum sp.]